MPFTQYPHITLHANHTPVIEGTTMKVSQLVAEKLAYGWSPEELHFQHPYLSLGQIHAALAYYWDHHEEVDAALSEQLNAFDTKRRAASGQAQFVRQLRQRLG